VLSLVLPLPLILLLRFTNRKTVMGDMVNKPLVRSFAVIAATVIIGLNLVLLWQTLHS
jgi:manganese transport protein